MHLKSKMRFCSCGGTIGEFGRISKVTIYTQVGPVAADHVESRCWKCHKGFFYGYSMVSPAEGQLNVLSKLYDEDCLESEVVGLNFFF